MENSDKGRSKWGDNSQDMRNKEDMKNGRRGKPQAAIYRPGSGPLRKSEEFSAIDTGRKAKSPDESMMRVQEFQDEFDNMSGKPGFSEQSFEKPSKAVSSKVSPGNHDTKLGKISDSLQNTSISSTQGNRSITKHRRNSLGNISTQSNPKNSDTKSKGKKPEQARYVPKLVAQAHRDVPKQVDAKVNKPQPLTKLHPGDDWDALPKFQQQRDARQAKSEIKSNVVGNANSAPSKSEGALKSRVEINRYRDKVESDHNWTSKDVGNGHSSMLNSTKVTSKVENIPHDHEIRASQVPGNRRNYHSRDNDAGNSHTSSNSKPRPPPPTLVSRELRQASEPRVLPPTSSNLELNRTRDTRSVEPAGSGSGGQTWPSSKVQAKPPSGRRGSGKDMVMTNVKPSKPMNFDSLPPRLRKKYLLENGIAEPSTLIGKSTSEDVWDGSTITFQGNAPPRERPSPAYHHHHQHHHHQQQQQQQQHQQQQHSQQQYSLPPPPHEQYRQAPPGHLQHPQMQMQFHQQQMQQQWANTLPARARGRGRLRPEELEMERAAAVGRFSRSLTPDRLSMPPPPPPDAAPPGFSASFHGPRTPPLSPSREERRGSSQHSDSRLAYDHHDDRRFARRRSESDPWEGVAPQGRRREDVRSPTTSVTPDSEMGAVPAAKPLDWGDEVEETERLEAEGKLYGSSSERSHGHSRSKNKRSGRRKRNSGGTDERSLSRGRDESGERNRYRGHSRDQFARNRSRDRQSAERSGEPGRLERNWREPDRQSKEKSVEKLAPANPNHIAGIIVLPPPQAPGNAASTNAVPQYQNQNEPVPYPTYRSVNNPQVNNLKPQQQRQLFNPNNPTKPILVSASGPRAISSSQSEPPPALTPTFVSSPPGAGHGYPPTQFPPSDLSSYGIDSSRPSWYDPYSTSFRASHNPHLILDMDQADKELHTILRTECIFTSWNKISYIRQFLQQCLRILLTTDIKFCQTENVEHHLWKILFYNIIELLRKRIADDPENKERNKQIVLTIIDDGTAFLESLLDTLEITYKFKLEAFLNPTQIPAKGLGFAGLALVSAQKLYLFLGDLARYKDQVNETSNFGKSRQWYIKAHQINPRNGRPYNQLAILAVYARRKLDAVYYYMRSLMASNPFLSAKDSLVTLFDENRKKFEQSERKRREERESRMLERMKEKEGAGMECGGNGLRRECWIRPEGGRRRLHITSAASQEQQRDSEEEDLKGLSSSEVNKRFVTSYMNVHGKLFAKVGMETFQEAALQMLREFRALLQHSPIPLNANRFLQLLALNMFAIDNTQLKDSQLEEGYRSAAQENALIVSIQMFNLLLEKCVSLLKEQLLHSGEGETPLRLIVGEDLLVLLPAVKVWCDWLLCHGVVWNPPPSCVDYRVGPPGDVWSRLATMVNLLNKLDNKEPELVTNGDKAGYELVRLPEDATLSGFTPLMYNTQEPSYTPCDTDMEVAQVALRIRKIIFFGTEFLCGIDPPVIKLQKFEGVNEYVSVVQSSSLGSPSTPPEEHLSDSELNVESFSEDDDEPTGSSTDGLCESDNGDFPDDIGALIARKQALERRQNKLERHRQRVQAILRDSVVSVEIEVKPHYLVPDTNCFIDYLSQLQKIAHAGSPIHLYTLTVPLVVFKELEGLSRGGKGRQESESACRVGECARTALAFLRSRHPAVRCVTSRGTVLASTTFTMEEDTDGVERNDDRILTTALNLSSTSGRDLHKAGEPRRLYREVVLLTEDRNLRVKALARDIPVREVPVFAKWADLG